MNTKDSLPQINRVFLLLLADLILIQAAGFFALYLRFDFQFLEIPNQYMNGAINYAAINTITTILLFVLFQLYKSVWRYASSNEVIKIIGASLSSAILQACGFFALNISMPRSYHIIYAVVLTCGLLCIRFSYRIIRMAQEQRLARGYDNRTKIMIVGAGEAGVMLIKELQTSQLVNSQVACVVDDDMGKRGKYLRGIKIEGGREDIPELVEKHSIEMIIIAIPSAKSADVKGILEICQDLDCQLKIVPGLYQIVNGEVSVSKLRDVQIEDLLGREPLQAKLDSVSDYVSGKTVLITGGGGTIGSELCRQIAGYEPKRLVIFDVYENNAYAIQQELKRNHPELDLVVLIGSVRNTHRIDMVMETYRPDIVYHAAAHKHVPLMEDSPNESIKNNVFGTYKTACAADKFGVKRFVLISTDKAVNPTNIMGASKRLCEMVIQTVNKHSKTEFVAVRFGNVLGSNGSVIPLFRQQIESGGPVTVTHPDIIRFFMTIPEAVSLVLQAGAFAKGGEIFILDMGEPVKIVDLAYNLIRLSGYRPNEDIKITFTGLRPGEKLYEETLMDEEGLQETENKLIHIGKPIDFDEIEFLEKLKELKVIADSDSDLIKEKVKEIVTTYQPQ